MAIMGIVVYALLVDSTLVTLAFHSLLERPRNMLIASARTSGWSAGVEEVAGYYYQVGGFGCLGKGILRLQVGVLTEPLVAEMEVRDDCDLHGVTGNRKYVI